MYSHKDKVVGVHGLFVGHPAAEVEVATAAGSLKEQGTALADATMTLTNKTLTAPGLTWKVATHDYGAAAAAWTLSAAEALCPILSVSNASGAVDIVAPADTGRLYLVNNQSGQACTVKKSGGTGISIASTKRAIVWYGGTDYVRITADA